MELNRKSPTTSGIEKLFCFFFKQILKGEADDKSLTFLGMSHDDAKGVISLSNEIFDITWDDLGLSLIHI